MSKVVIGIIGAGNIGKLHVNNLDQNKDIRIKKVSDLFADELQDWASNNSIEEMTKDHRDILDDSEIDAVFICSPTNTHASIIKEAAKQKKHIFCEKPISFSDEETLEAYEAVKEHGVKFQIGFNRRFDRNFAEMKNRLQNKKLGDLHLLKITSRDPMPPSPGYVETSGGLFFDMTIHDFDMARHLAGSEVTEVFAQAANLVDPEIGKKGDVDTAVITLKFENGAIGVIDNSREAVYGYDQRIEVFGNGGALVADNETSTNLKYYHKNAVETDKPVYFFLERYNEAFIAETKEFIESIMEDKETKIVFKDGIMAQRIAQAATDSYASGKPVKVTKEIR